MEQNKSLALKIQEANYDDPVAQAWRTSMMYAQMLPNNQWVRIVFDHMLHNGSDVWRIVHEKKGKILDNGGTCDLLPDGSVRVEPLETPFPPFEIYVGGPNILARDVIKLFHQLNKPHETYIPVNMWSTLGATALLNYTFDNAISFEENWEEIKRLKANENDYLLENNRWKLHIASQYRWVSFLRMESFDELITMEHYCYDPDQLQGLGVTQHQHASYFVFSFWADPTMKDIFIEKYQLTRM